MPLPRRVWRMTADAPHGEVLELLPKAAESRPSSPGTRAGTPSGGRLAGEVESSPDESAKVLTPAKAPTWQASSFDLMTGATAEEVTDTIPGDLYDELFPTRR